MSFLPDRTLDHLRRVVEEPDLSGTGYRIEEELGRGGMGIVYQAWDGRLRRRVALKVIDAGHEEATILAQLEHPGLVPVYDAGALPDGRLYYAMRLVRGQRLDEFLRGEPSLAARLRVFQKVCEAVAFAHDRGVIHCDLKPQNVMAGSFGEVFVMDWGIARLTGEAVHAPATAIGTPPYMAPEPSRDCRADVFSLGRILEDVMGDTRPRPLAAVARRAMAPDLAQRYASVQQLSLDVTRFLDGEPVTAYRENFWEHGVRFAKRNQVLLLLLATFLVVKVALFFLARR